MPGPGGGSHGGGGSRGGGFSGGSHGGGFGGRPMGGGPMGGRPMGGMPMGGAHMWGHPYRRRRAYYGGGCLGGALGMGMTLVILVLFIVIWLVSLFGSGVNTMVNGGDVVYNESAFQQYADEQYAKAFGGTEDYEDHLLIVFLVDEDHYNYYYIAWVGDHVDARISNMLGNNDTELGWAMSSCINATNYEYSLDSNLAQVMQTMEEEITGLGLQNSLTCGRKPATVKAYLTNNTALPMTESTVNGALAHFADATGISTVIVVEDMEDVFGKTLSGGSVLGVVLVIAVAAVVVIFLVKKIRSKYGDEGDDTTGDGRYSSFDDQY